MRITIRALGWSLVGLGLAAGAARAQATSVYLEELTWPEIRDAMAAGKTSAIIYIGSTEQNGPHMVLGKHNFVAHQTAGRIAERLGDALVYPTLPFAPTGDLARKTGHMRFPGSVSLSASVFSGVVRDVAQSALAAGFKHVFLLGDHGGGQDELRRVAAELDASWGPRGAHVHHVPDLYYKTRDQTQGYLTAHGITPGSHAGAHDTSELMFLDTAGRWIRRDRLAPSDSTREPATGVNGDPSRATAEMGRIFLDNKVNNAVTQIRTLLTQTR